MNLAHYLSPFLLAGALFWPLGATTLQASHAHLDRGESWWKPVRQIELTAPTIPDAQERLNKFAERNNPENLEKLAREFFGIINPNSPIMGPETNPGYSVMDDWGRYSNRHDSLVYEDTRPKPASIRDLLNDKKYAEALELYKKRFFERFANPPSGFLLKAEHPRKRIFMEFLHKPDELMNNVATFCMYKKPQEDETLDGIVVKMNIGQPGAVNWTYTPEGYGAAEEHLADDERMTAMCYSHSYYFDQLLIGYVDTGDVKYLKKYAEFLDDRSMNFWADVRAAGYFYQPSPAGIDIIKHLAWAAQNVPGFKENFPAPTLARILLDFWKFNAASAVRMVRGIVPNRQVDMYLREAWIAAASMPEFEPAAYIQREMVRLIEAPYACDVMPDGSNIEHNTGYNAAMINVWRFWKEFSEAKVLPKRVNAQWMLEYRDNLINTARYIAQNRACNGWDWYSMYYLPRKLKFEEIFPEAFADPAIQKAIPITMGLGPENGLPNYTSVAWPYMGIYILRNGWDPKRSQECYMAAPRPYNTHNWKNNLDIQMFGYGQPLLTAQTEGYGYRRGPGQSAWEKDFRKEQIQKYNDPYRRGMYQWDFTPVFVDGCPQIDHAGFDSLPEDVQQVTKYGRRNNRAYYTPLPGRWHESEHFNIMEGTYEGEFAEFKPDPDAKGVWLRKNQKPGKVTKLITDVRESRQVILLKKPGFWIIADRLQSPAEHSYQLDWKFAQKWENHGEQIPGFDRSEIAFDADKNAFITHDKESANISLYMNGARKIAPYYKPETNHYGAEFSGTGSHLVVTAAFPREKDAVDLKNYKGFCADGIAGFDAELPDGAQVICRAANEIPGALSAGPVSGKGEMLVYLKEADGTERCFALGMKSISIKGAEKKLPAESAEFVIRKGAVADVQPVRSPLGLVKILPEADVFTDKVDISMSHEDPGVEIRYTLDGTDPTLCSQVYSKPISSSIPRVVVKARAFRKGLKEIPECPGGTLASDISRAVYEKVAPQTPAKTEPKNPGLNARFIKGDGYLTAFTPMKVVEEKKSTVTELFEGVGRNPSADFAVEYTGFLVVPEDGIYTLHAPAELINNNFDGGYDLRLWLGEGRDKQEWYPATRLHNFGGWSVALQKGAHPIRMLYVDQRGGNVGFSFLQWNGQHPTLEVSGPGLERQAIPKEWLRH